jgi:type 1 glutamine amidotransferase
VTALRTVGAFALMVCACGSAGPAPSAEVLVFTRTTGFRHASIPAGIAAMRELSAQAGHSVSATEDSAAFRDAVLARTRAVVFLNTTGTVLNDEQRSALERWVRAGGGFLGVHSAADTEYGWPFYGELLGARFASHPAVQSATVHVIDRAHPATAGLPGIWTRTDEWYDFRAPPSAVRVLAEVDESTYQGGRMGPHHPIVWAHAVDAGRSIYIAMGHTEESYSEELFRSLLLGALRYAAGDATPP